MSGKKLAVLIGHSHTGALVNAITNRTPAEQAGRDTLHVAMFEAWKFKGNPPYVTPDDQGQDRFNPAVLEAWAPYAAYLGRPVYLALFGGNDWSVLSMMRHDRPFDFILPEAPDLPLEPGFELVPLAYIQSILGKLTDKYMNQLASLRAAVDDPIYSFVPPPPIDDDVFITEKLDDFFKTNADFTQTISPKYMRLKMWMLQRTIQRKVCAECGITLFDVPATAMTRDGFLDPSCYGHDASHGNALYGDLMLQQVEEATRTSLLEWYWVS